jgi:hypothetical protein
MKTRLYIFSERKHNKNKAQREEIGVAPSFLFSPYTVAFISEEGKLLYDAASS